MRIGIVCPYNYFRPGGVQVCVREIAAELERRGHYVRVIVPTPKVVPEIKDKNLIFIGGSTEFHTPFATKADLSMSGSDEQIDAVFQAERFDVLHFHEPGIPVWGMQLLGRSKAANVGTMHAMLPEGVVSKSFIAIMKPAAKFIEPRLQIITAVSEAAKTTALEYSPHANIRIIPNGIRLEDYRPTSSAKVVPKSNAKKTIVYVGRLERRKGVRYLLLAYAALREQYKDVCLVLAGDGKLRDSLEALVKKYDIPDVSFRGFVSEEEKIKLMQSADIYCSPALYGESFGIVLLEAMAAGTIVICGDNPGYASVMTERGRLSLVNPRDTISFAERLALFLQDEDLRKLWKKWAKTHVAQFEYKKVVDQYEQAYRDALAANKHKS